ncbi:DUF4942 domain-containing protein [Vibrio furnissii]|uniref:DUF4942 domain-containing protein n=1 Tax=Vibrio furnissii TaxID=29494 RepID=UPI001EEA917A|nr:DUF4942 domain-containing protein [Vibrio furnissii]
MNNSLRERLNAYQICERRDQIEACITQAVSLLGEADSLLKTICDFGLSFDRNTFYDLSDAHQRYKSIRKLTVQVDKKLWSHIFELGQFRDLMSAEKYKSVDNDLDTPPQLTYDTLTATFNDLLNDRVNMLQNLTESVFKHRSRSFVSNTGHKLNKRLIFEKVFSSDVWRVQKHLIEDACKVFSVLTGCPVPEVISILEVSDEPLIAFDGKVKFVAYQNGNVHVWLLDRELEYKINDVLNGCFDGQLAKFHV